VPARFGKTHLIIRRCVQAPTLLLVVDHEVLFDPTALASRATQLIPNTCVEIVHGAGHASPFDQPDLASKRIVELLGHDAAVVRP